MTTYSVRIEDDELAEMLEDAENKSEVFREGVRLWAVENRTGEYPGVSDAQAAAYERLLETAGPGGRIELERALTELAQEFSRGKDLVKSSIIHPLKRAGYLRVTPRMNRVDVVVLPPEVGDANR